MANNTMATAPTGNPLLIGGGMALDAIGSAFSGGKDPALGNLHLVNSAQQYGWNKMLERLLSGSGDYGFGNSVNTGKNTLDQMFADRGVSKDSGYYGAAMGDLIGSASAQDQQNRANMMLNLLRTPLDTQVIAGANFVPGSVSGGPTTQVQTNEYSKWRQRGYVPHGVGQSGGAYRYSG